MANEDKKFVCPFKASGETRCPAKHRDAGWNCPLVSHDENCAINVIANQLYLIQVDGIKQKK